MKYQNNQYNKITMGTKWELYKTKSFGSKSKREGGGGGGGGGGEFRYHSENLRHSENSNFLYAQ